MSIPQNPETVIIKNEFYPNGLKEIDIWNYYQKTKTQLLRETLGKNLIVFLATDINKNIVLRKNKSGGLIRLNYSDYNTIVSGRTLSFHSIMRKYSNFGIIDIDTTDFEMAKNVTIDIYDIMKKSNFVKDLKILFTGKDSFHIRVLFNNDYKIDNIKNMIYNFLVENEVNNKYTILSQRTKKIPNIDLYRNVFNNGYISLYSLSVIGLKCMEVDRKLIKKFNKELAII